MTTKHIEPNIDPLELTDDPWEIWPDGIIPAEGSRPEIRLRTAEEGAALIKQLAEFRKDCRFPSDVTALDIIRRERDE